MSFGFRPQTQPFHVSLENIMVTAWYMRFQLPSNGFSSMTRRKLPVIVVSVAGLVAFFILCVVYGTGEGSWSTIFPSLSSHQESNVGGGVVLLTAVTYERLGVFAAVDDFYTKLWRNRLGYAKTHGIYPFTTFYIVGYDNLLIDLNKFP